MTQNMTLQMVSFGQWARRYLLQSKWRPLEWEVIQRSRGSQRSRECIIAPGQVKVSVFATILLPPKECTYNV